MDCPQSSQTPSLTAQRFNFWTVFCFLILILFIFIRPVMAELVVTPTRVDLNDKTRTATISLVSQSKEPTTYRISWIHFTMQPDGSYVETPDPRSDARTLESLIRFSPRQVTLIPGETQAVRLSLSPKSDLTRGEFRSHLVFRADPTPFAQSEAGSEGVSINLAIAKGVAIPIVYRKGDLQMTATLAKPQLIKRPDQHAVSVVIQRSGSASPFGELEVLGTIDGKEKMLGQVKGVAVFLEIESRTVKIPLNDPTEFSKAKHIRILYYQTSAMGQRSQILAEVPMP